MPLKYMICEVCASNSTAVIPIVNVHKVLLAKLFDLLNIHMTILPTVCCDTCFMKLLSFDDLLRQLLKRYQTENYIKCKDMQKDPLEENKYEKHPEESKLLPEEDIKKEPLILHSEQLEGIQTEIKHQYNCECSDCQIKYGSLPLLVQVIEGQEKNETLKCSNPDASEMMIDQPGPSTSARGHSSNSARKEMKCPYCEKLFTHKGDMNKHIRKHTGEQPFSCHICDKKFAHTSNLSRHLLVHSGDRPFECENCGRKFSRKDKLQLHQKTKLCNKLHSKSGS